MRIVKGFLAVIYALICLFAAALLASYLYFPQVYEFFSTNRVAEYVYYGTAGLVAFGAVCMLLAVIFTPRNHKVITSKLSGGAVEVSRKAIASVVQMVAERDHQVEVDRVVVKIPGGKAEVRAYIRPLVPLNTQEHGQRLHDEIEAALRELCADKVKRIVLNYGEPSEDGFERSEPAVIEPKAQQIVVPEAELDSQDELTN